MWRYIFGVVIIAGLAVEVPKYLDTLHSEAPKGATRSENLNLSSKEAAPRLKPQNVSVKGRVSYIKAGYNGQFVARAKLNGYRSDVLVDTGASAVAINETTARRMGIRLKSSDFKYKVQTANGITMAASAMIREIKIGKVVVRDVRAMVSKDKALNVVLLGMTFLNRLKKYEFNQGTLILTQ